MSKIDITKQEFDKLMSFRFNLGRSAESSSVTVSPKTMKSDEKIYVFPNCKIKKLPMRKYIKSLGVKQVFKPEEADILVVPNSDNFISNSSYNSCHINVCEGYKVKAGVYNYGYNDRKYCEWSNDEILRGGNLKYFVFHTMVQKNANQNCYEFNTRIDEVIETLPMTYSLLTKYGDITEEHVKALLKPGITLIDELDMQQEVYDWEVAEDVRVSTDDYNWEGIQSLLENEDNYNVAITIIQKLNIEPILSKLVALYLSRSTGSECKKALYNKVFVRKPILHENLNHPNNVWYHEGNITQALNTLKSEGVELDYNDFRVANLEITELRSSNKDSVLSVRYTS